MTQVSLAAAAGKYLFALLAGPGVSAYNAPPFEPGTTMEKPQTRGLLLVGVRVLAGMTWRLIQQMKAKAPDKPPL